MHTPRILSDETIQNELDSLADELQEIETEFNQVVRNSRMNDDIGWSE